MKIPHWLPLLTALLIYTLTAAYQLDKPGLHHDEAQEAGLLAMQIQTGQPLSLFRGLDSAVVFQNRAWPLMVQDYIGSLNVYLGWFAFGLFGVSVESLRGVMIAVGVLTLISAYGASKTLFGYRAATLTVLLMAIHPTFVFWTRQGVYITSITLPLALGSLWLLARWWDGGRPWTLWLAAFLMGLGLWSKLLFVWYIGAVFGAWLLINLYQWQALRTLRHHMKPLVIAALCGLLGLAPLIHYNLKAGGTLDNIFNNFDQSYYGVDNANVGENFQERLRQAPLVFESGHLRELGGLFHNPIARVWLIVSGVACLIAAAAFREKRGMHLFLPLMVLLMIAQSSFTSTALWFTHFALILPFMVMLGAVGAVSLVDLLASRLGKKPAQILVMAWVVLMLAYDARTLANYHRALRETGGLATHSSAIYALADRLDTQSQATPIVALDWGISPAVGMLTQGRVMPAEIFGYQWEADGGFTARLAPYLDTQDTLYILHVPDETVFPRRDPFLAAVRDAGKESILIETIFTPTNTPYFEVWLVH